MKPTRRIVAVLFSALALVALVLLAAGLRRLVFSQGYPLAFQWQTGEVVMGGRGTGADDLFLGRLIQLVIIAVLVMVPFLILYMIVSKEGRKWALRSLGVVVTILAVYYMLRSPGSLLQGVQTDFAPAAPLDPAARPPFDLSLGPPAWLAWVMTFALALFAALPLVGLGWILWRSRRQKHSPLDELAREARHTLDALQAGSDLRDAVLRCYYEMSRVLSHERGITRERAMTPREFEVFLGQSGLPEEQVRDLTRLFERVRYGARVPGEREKQQAIRCLNAIVAASRSGA